MVLLGYAEIEVPGSCHYSVRCRIESIYGHDGSIRSELAVLK